MDRIAVKKCLVRSIQSHLRYEKVERGGILMLHKNAEGSLEITDYWIDETQGSVRFYQPGNAAAERIAAAEQGDIPAFVHSHPDFTENSETGNCQLSAADIYYAREFIKLNSWKEIYMFVVPGEAGMAGYKVTFERCTNLNIDII